MVTAKIEHGQNVHQAVIRTYAPYALGRSVMNAEHQLGCNFER